MAPRFVFPVPSIRGWTSGSDPKRGGGGGGASFNGKKASLRPKFVATYEYLLRGTETEGSPAPRRAEPRFWDDLFLLDVNHQFLADALRKLSERELLERAPAVTEICARCLDFARLEPPSSSSSSGSNTNETIVRSGPDLLRSSRALETLVVILTVVSRRKFAERGLGVIDVCAGGEKGADAFFARLIAGCASLAANHLQPCALRRLALRALLAVSTAKDNVSGNALCGYFMVYDAYEPLMKILIASVDVPGGGSDSARTPAATALRNGASGFGKDSLGETTSIDVMLGGDGGVTNTAADTAAKETKEATGAASLGTTRERERLREEAAYLFAALLSWRESANAYAKALERAGGVELSVILRVACALLASPPTAATADADASDPNQTTVASTLAGAGASIGSVVENVSSAVFGAAAPPAPDDLIDSLMTWLGYDPSSDDDAAAAAGGDARRWEISPPPCAGLLLLHGLVSHSGLLHLPSAWLRITPKPNEMLHGVPISQRWHEALGRVLCYSRRLCAFSPPPAGTVAPPPPPATVAAASSDDATATSSSSWFNWITDYGGAAGGDGKGFAAKAKRVQNQSLASHAASPRKTWVGAGSAKGGGAWVVQDDDATDARLEFASAQANLSLSLLRTLMDDQSAAEFLHGTDISRLAVDAASSSSGAASSSTATASRPIAAAILELLSGVLYRGAPGKRNAVATVAVESHAVYVIHRVLQTQIAKGGRGLPFRWSLLWDGLLAVLRRCAKDVSGAAGDALGSPGVCVLVSQTMNAISFILVNRGALLSRAEDIAPLILAFVLEEQETFAPIAHGAAMHGYLVQQSGGGGGGGGGGRGSAAERSRGAAGVRMENVHHAQQHFRTAPRDKDALRVAIERGLALLTFPVKDRLDAGWGLRAAPSAGGGVAGWDGTGFGAAGSSASAERVVANSTRCLVVELSRGVVSSVPEGLKPAIPEH